MWRILWRAARFATNRNNDLRIYYVGAIGQGQDGRWVHARNEPVKFPTPSCHAEARLVRRLGYYAPVVYVARYSKGKQELAMAKPCRWCELILRHYKVKKVIYTTGPDSCEEMWLC